MIQKAKHIGQPITMFVFIVLLLTFWFIARFFRALLPKHNQNHDPRPPGPWGLPVIGHLHMLGDLPHRSLRKIAQKYGPIMQIRLGNVPTVVVSSPEAAELFLKKHDVNFAGRPTLLATELTSYGTKGLAFSKYGSHWRNTRKLCTSHLLSISKIESFMDLRNKEMIHFIRNLKCAADGGEVVNISAQVRGVIQRITCEMIFGSGYKRQFNFIPCVEEALTLAGAFNVADYIPFLKLFDLQGLNRRIKRCGEVMDSFQEKIIQEHENYPGQEGRQMDFIDVLLSLMKSSDASEVEFSRTNVKAIAFDMLAGGLDTTATTIEWVLTELLRHPRVMKLVQDELATVVGLDRLVEKSDLKNLAYLDMVIKETMRLHPVAPLLLPYESLEDASLGGYYVPKRSRIIVNAWAIGRYPNAWSNNTEEFFPERFVNNDIDVRGRDMQLIPFGTGRRQCPGTELGIRTVHFVLAQLLHCFMLKLPGGMLLEDIDTDENSGLATPRASPLKVIPIYCLKINNI